MSDASNALATANSLTSLTLRGQKLRSDVAEVLQDAVVTRSLDGASTLTLEIYDDARTLLKKGVFNERLTAQVDDYSFELVQVRKSGTGLSVTLEDLPVAVLRRRDTQLKVAPGTITHVEFAERMIKEEAWLNVWTPKQLRAGERTKVELSRGQPASDSGESTKEDTWTALGRIADERGWRRYVLNPNTIAYVPETYLLEQTATYVLREGKGGVEDLDFDFDTGKAVATLKAKVRAGRWEVPVGTAVEVKDLGPVNGRWIVSDLSRSLFSLFIDVTLTKARPVLPEPKPEPVPSATPTTVGTGVAGPGFTGGGTWPDDPKNLVSIGQGGHRLASPAASSFKQVEQAFGRQIPVTDSYRSVASQVANYRKAPNRFGKPGNSAHGEARAVDVNLQALGIYPQGSPSQWRNNAGYARLAAVFEANGWGNYQLKNGTTKGRTSEPWHFSYQVCK